MASMLLFTLVFNAVGWAAITLTDLFLGSVPFIDMILLAEWFVIPMSASAIYRVMTYMGRNAEKRERTMHMLMWFVIGAGVSGVICKAIDEGRWFANSVFDRFDYLSFAAAFVLGFIIYTALYEVVRFFVEGGFEAHRMARGH